VTSPAPRAAWRELLAADPRALAFQSPDWLDAMRAAGGYEDASRLYETPGGSRILLPLARRRLTFPDRLAPQGSFPNAWGMGGVLADGPIDQTDLARVARDLAALRSLRTSVRPNPLQADLWAAATEGLGVIALTRRAHVLDLRGGPDEVWKKRFASSARNKIRKGERSGLEVECGSSERLVEAFHQLLERSVERWAKAQNEPLALARLRARRRDPLAKFKAIARALGDSLRVWVAFREGVAVAASIVLLEADASYTRGAMDKELAGPVAANDLLQWHAIREACAAGCGRYHMGESGQSRDLAKFKEKLGAEAVDYAEYRFERLPLTRIDAAARGLAKRALRFRDA
jgi:lipid II:glycine glycyltransferase (peptidoglycan interpeptide bridge formation enzyme)